MKTTFYNIVVAGLALLALGACEKDEERAILQPGGSLALTPSTTTVSLSKDNATKEAVVFNWTPAQYGFPAPANYTLQFGKKGNSFKDSVEVSAGVSTKLSMTVASLNDMLLKLGLKPGSSGQVDVRVKSELSRPNTGPSNQLYSTAQTITGTPYATSVQYPTALYVPGAYQGWSPDKAPSLALLNNDGSYEGYVYLSGASEFKLTTAPNWDNTNYGTGGTGKLSDKGGNLSIDAPGYYLIKADLSKQTWSATKTAWSIIGAATPKGWDAGTPLTYDTKTGTLTTTLDLKADEFKFRANDAWDINFGDGNSKDNVKADGILDYGGDNLKVPSAGKYLVTLDLSKAGKYTYILTKQ